MYSAHAKKRATESKRETAFDRQGAQDWRKESSRWDKAQRKWHKQAFGRLHKGKLQHVRATLDAFGKDALRRRAEEIQKQREMVQEKREKLARKKREAEERKRRRKERIEQRKEERRRKQEEAERAKRMKQKQAGWLKGMDQQADLLGALGNRF